LISFCNPETLAIFNPLIGTFNGPVNVVVPWNTALLIGVFVANELLMVANFFYRLEELLIFPSVCSELLVLRRLSQQQHLSQTPWLQSVCCLLLSLLLARSEYQ